ncbi:hypothetical protein RA19_12400 [Leisingera sp. ANG-M1]|nr:hypothetical protein RA19_12400 [Leisingera sp. ANG-M1]
MKGCDCIRLRGWCIYSEFPGSLMIFELFLLVEALIKYLNSGRNAVHIFYTYCTKILKTTIRMS